MDITSINEESILIRFGDNISDDLHHRVKYYFKALKDYPGLLSLVPSYNSLMIYYDVLLVDLENLKKEILNMSYDNDQAKTQRKVVEIPVCYDLGLDIERVSEHTGFSSETIVDKHTAVDYLVYMIGFTPGFPYLGGLDESLTTPRLEVPRTRIEAGSVGIGGSQTGIYPLDTPGGWNIIGKTPLDLFDKNTSETLLEMGDYIRFVSIDESSYHEIKRNILNDTYEMVVVTC